MYSLTIHFGPNAMCWQFLFKEKENAYAAQKEVWAKDTGWLDMDDDFGQFGRVLRSSVHGVLLEDLDLVEEAQIQRSLVNARAQAKLNSRAAQDPTLRAAQAMRGPAMIQPMGRG